MSRILVIGGRGYYGQQVVQTLNRLDGHTVAVASSRAGAGDERIDVKDPSTFTAMKGYDLVVNSSDTVGAPPDALARWCLEHGVSLFDMGADAPTAARLLDLEMEVAEPTGHLVVGVGIFPGLSTSLAHELAEEASEPVKTLELGVRLSPLSGSGEANCRLMTGLLADPGMSVRNHQRVAEPTVGATVNLPYAHVGTKPSIQVGLPDAPLIARATGAPEVTTYLALVPSIARFNVRVLATIVAWSGVLRPALLWSLERVLWLTRAVLLRSVKTSVEMTVVADRGLPTERARLVSVPNGQEGTALGVGAAVAAWLDASPPAPGVYAAGELFPFATMTRALERLGAADALITQPG